MKRIALLFSICINTIGFGQLLSEERSVDWTLAGLKNDLPSFFESIDFIESGGIGDGEFVNNTIFEEILSEIEDEPFQIRFPAGTFFFNAGLILPSNIELIGAGADSTTLIFDLGGASINMISATGNTTATSTEILAPITKDETTCTISESTDFEIGDWVQIMDNDSSLITSSWAYHTTGQILQIKTITEDEFEFDSPFRRDYILENTPYLVRLEMKENISIQNLKLIRQDASAGQSSNILFRYTVNSQVKCIKSEQTNFAHIRIDFSSNCEVRGSYFQGGHDYGGGGKAYGVVCHLTTGECLITDNNFKHLRHSMLLQAGANGNVYSYNYSQDPYWIEVSTPPNSAGDAVLHGNYAYCNLFEGNIIQNIVIDDSHGMNGPYNTFFRNRAELYGIFMNSTIPSNSQNFIGNEIPNEGSFFGLYYFEGTDHFKYGNNHRGVTKPEGTSEIEETSLYLESEIPFYYTAYSAWPPIGYPNLLNENNNESYNNYEDGYEIQCENTYEDLSAKESNSKSELLIYPNPSTGLIFLELKEEEIIQKISLYSITGYLIHTIDVNNSETSMDLSFISKGIYPLKIETETHVVYWSKIVLR